MSNPGVIPPADAVGSQREPCRKVEPGEMLHTGRSLRCRRLRRSALYEYLYFGGYPSPALSGIREVAVGTWLLSGLVVGRNIERDILS